MKKIISLGLVLSAISLMGANCFNSTADGGNVQCPAFDADWKQIVATSEQECFSFSCYQSLSKKLASQRTQFASQYADVSCKYQDNTTKTVATVTDFCKSAESKIQKDFADLNTKSSLSAHGDQLSCDHFWIDFMAITAFVQATLNNSKTVVHLERNLKMIDSHFDAFSKTFTAPCSGAQGPKTSQELIQFLEPHRRKIADQIKSLKLN